DLGINKGVVYLLIAALGSILLAFYVNRKVRGRTRVVSGPQTVVEGLYEFAHDQIAPSLGTKMFSRYMPYIAAIFVFVLLLNLTSFVPLPLNTHHNIGDLDYLYSFGLYAVTSNIYCTATLALMTFFVYHFEGVRAHGLFGYLGTWRGGQKGPISILIFAIEALSNIFLKPLSLALRLFANMLSGHILILLMLGLAGILAGSLLPTLIAQIGGGVLALAFYLFEMVLIAGLQAFIFAILSAIYIGGAAEEHH
ncbi:MAG: ATP synthase F0 subunit A, partial [Proteobacteria bacterium]